MSALSGLFAVIAAVSYLTSLVLGPPVPVSAPLAPAASPSVSPEPAADLSSFLNMDLLEEPLPLVYSDTLKESVLQEHMKKGAVVLPLGTAFGQPGNVVVTAHSTGFKSFGRYRFAFAKLGRLEIGDEFTVDKDGRQYTYRVYKREVVWPNEVDKLPKNDRSTVTLITCWPLWTDFKRLLVHAELVTSDNEN